MTAEQLHDALTLLPTDLIAEADKARCPKSKTLRWKPLATLAACFVLILGSGLFLMRLELMGSVTEQAAAEAPAAAAPMLGEPESNEIGKDASPMEEAAPEETEMCSAPTASRQDNSTAALGSFNPTRRYSTPDLPDASYNTAATPENLVLTSRQELECYLEEHAWRYDFTDLTQDLGQYPEDWFRNHDLLVTVVHATPAETPWTITAIQDVRETDDHGWEWFVHVSHSGQYDPNRKITNVHLLTELDKNTIATGSAILTVYDTTGTRAP